MRRIARTVAASVVIILGLALVSVAAFSSDIATVTLPDAPKAVPEAGQVAPLDPNAGNSPVRKIPSNLPDIFATEFGKRGKHEVTVTLSGPAAYQVSWRDGKVEEGTGQLNSTKTVSGGFPLAFVAVNGLGASITCTITIDGVERDSQTSTPENSIVFCEG
jgi:hypothetical protein